VSAEHPPIWRRDFPYTSDGEDEVTRREFVRYLALASGAFAAGSVGVAAWTSLRNVNEGEPRAIVPLESVAVGGAHLFRYPTRHDPAILVRIADDEIRAYSQKCTHLGCVVYWAGKDDELVCPCHEGVFDGRTGDVISGPPQRPLGEIAVEVRQDGMIWALRGAGV
jgi:Rieske Fe-S protein